MLTKITHGLDKGDLDRYRADGGFSLIEILVAIVILSVPLVGIASLAGIAIKGNGYSRESTSASVLVTSQFDLLKNLAFTNFDHADLAAGAHTDYLDEEGGSVAQGSSLNVYTRAWNVTDDATPANMKTILMTISWTRDGATKSVSYTAKFGR